MSNAINLSLLCQFLVEAKRNTYAAGNSANKIVEKDGSTTLEHRKWDWKYHDNYFGGEPYGGREVVFFKNAPVYIMTYYGWVVEGIDDYTEVYRTLQQALLRIPEKRPYRWPQNFSLWEYEYVNGCTGEIDNFNGEEAIFFGGKEVYRARYMGGMVDQRR